MVQSLEGALLLEQNKVKECDKQLEDAMHNLELVRQDKVGAPWDRNTCKANIWTRIPVFVLRMSCFTEPRFQMSR